MTTPTPDPTGGPVPDPAPDPAPEPGASHPSRSLLAALAEKMRRSAALTIGGGLLVFLFSFLPQVSGAGGHENMWHVFGLVEVFTVPLVALAVAGFAVLELQNPAAGAKLPAATAAQWRDVLSIVPLIGSIFALFSWHNLFGNGVGIGWGAYVVFVFAIVVVIGTFAAPHIPALALPVSTGTAGLSRPSWTSGWGARSATRSAEAGPLPPTDAPTPPTIPGPVVGDSAETSMLPAKRDEPAPGEPPPSMQPFWACFPTVRPLLDESSGAHVGDVTPDEWYLVTVLDGRGATVQATTGLVGLLPDVSGMVRADD